MAHLNRWAVDPRVILACLQSHSAKSRPEANIRLNLEVRIMFRSA
jgi:hypothetical protein